MDASEPANARAPLSNGDDGRDFGAPAMSAQAREDVEAAIRKLVADFYGEARKDDLLGPVFEAAVEDWDGHLAKIADFWSRALLRTQRYNGFPFPAHARLQGLRPEHFARWLELFAESAARILPPAYAEPAIARARLMARSFVAGLFPFAGEDGDPSRGRG
ncbi:group III truncated hemoglobin [Methylocella sp.]|uniref:group III truncated hemoglobin n=1 Tax=Methylocella sp. TaxID=1978226 RepID=UPI003784279D